MNFPMSLPLQTFSGIMSGTGHVPVQRLQDRNAGLKRSALFGHQYTQRTGRELFDIVLSTFVDPSVERGEGGY